MGIDFAKAFVIILMLLDPTIDVFHILYHSADSFCRVCLDARDLDARPRLADKPNSQATEQFWRCERAQ